MFDNDRSPQDSEYYSTSSPEYSVFSIEMLKVSSIAAGLMVLTIAGMVAIANTPLAEFGLWLFEAFYLLGIIVFGALITAGRYIGLHGAKTENYLVALLGSALCVFAYSWFGGAILTPFSSTLYVTALIITSIITVAITLLGMFLVYSTDRNFQWAGRASALCFGGAFIFSIVGSFFTPIIILVFLLALAGFILDLVFEIWMVSDGRRSTVANGIAVYVAFAGTFVHILQIVLRALAESEG